MCSFCGLVFSQKLLLNNHLATKHTASTTYPCGHCPREFLSKSARSQHYFIAHKNTGGDLKYKCKECSIFFDMKEELRIHSFIHFNGEIKTCLDCNQIFKTNHLLKIHMQKHEKEKSFRCNACGDLFTFETGLAKHIRLRRCRGPKIKCQIGDEVDIAEIAKKQLQEITKRSRKILAKKEEKNVMFDIKDNSSSEDYNQFEDDKQILEKPEVLVKDEPLDTIEEHPLKDLKVEAETKESRKVRKKIHIPSIKSPIDRHSFVYTCDYCGEELKFKKRLLTHMKQHVECHFKYKCSECGIAFNSKQKFIDHSMVAHGAKPLDLPGSLTCEVCNMKFHVKSIYETHMLSHDDTARAHVCSFCQALFKTIGNLRRHEKIHAPTRNFLCPKCPKAFKTELALKIHDQGVHAEYRVVVKCPVCNKFFQENFLKVHIKNMHTEKGKEKPFSCAKCDKTFKTEKLTQRHFEAVHDPKPQGTVYLCSKCPELLFSRHRDLKQHSFIHFDGVIYQCSVCLKKFRTKQLLVCHSKAVHCGGGEFPCEFCEDVVFKTRSGRGKHYHKLHFDQL